MVKYVSGAEYPRIDDFEARYNSDENQVLDSLTRIEQKAKEYGVDIDSVYNKIGFDPISFLLNNKNDAWLRETENYVSVVIERTGRKKNFIKDENAVLGFFETAETGHETGGKGFLAKTINWIEKHPYLSAGALLAAYAGAIGVNQYQNNDKFADYVDKNVEKAKSEIMLGSAAISDSITEYFGKLNNKPPVADFIIRKGNYSEDGSYQIVKIKDRSYDPDGEISKIEIKVNGNLVQTAKNGEEIEDLHLEPGSYNKIYNIDNPKHYLLELTVFDDKGKSDTEFKNLEINQDYDIEKRMLAEKRLMRRYVSPCRGLRYDGICIKGTEDFQKQIVMALEFTKKYSPPDYQFIKNYTKEIEALPEDEPGGRGGNYWTGVNVDVARDYYDTKIIALKVTVETLAHEAGHSYADAAGLSDKFEEEAKKMCGSELKTKEDLDACGKKLGKPSYWQWHPAELFAESFADSAEANLSYVNDSEIDKFIQNFNFSKFKKN